MTPLNAREMAQLSWKSRVKKFGKKEAVRKLQEAAKKGGIARANKAKYFSTGD